MQKDRKTLLAEAEQLRRRWFKQLQAIEGAPEWPKGWERLEYLRSLIKQVQSLPAEDLPEAESFKKLSTMLQEATDL